MYVIVFDTGCPEKAVGLSRRRYDAASSPDFVMSDDTGDVTAGRLHGNDPWCTTTGSRLTVDLKSTFQLYGIATQGGGSTTSWVQTYKLYFSLDGSLYEPYVTDGNLNEVRPLNSLSKLKR